MLLINNYSSVNWLSCNQLNYHVHVETEAPCVRPIPTATLVFVEFLQVVQHRESSHGGAEDQLLRCFCCFCCGYHGGRYFTEKYTYTQEDIYTQEDKRIKANESEEIGAMQSYGYT